MHEFSLAQSLIEKIEELRAAHNAKKIHSVHLLVGKHSGVVIDSFEFAFDVLKREHNSLIDAKLITQIMDNELTPSSLSELHPERENDARCYYCTDVILKTIEME